jgi:hypothetical protein
VKRSIGVERIYNLGDYNNIKLSEYLNDVPEDLWTNERFTNRVRLLQLLSLEATFRKYQALHESLNRLPIEEALPKLEELSVGVMTEIKNLIDERSNENE